MAVDLRVDDHADPIAELERLMGVHELLFPNPLRSNGLRSRLRCRPRSGGRSPPGESTPAPVAGTALISARGSARGWGWRTWSTVGPMRRSLIEQCSKSCSGRTERTTRPLSDTGARACLCSPPRR